MKRSATARPFAMTKKIEPAYSVGNGLEVTGQAPFKTTPAKSLAEGNAPRATAIPRARAIPHGQSPEFGGPKLQRV
jgi:hypothetical protein